MVNDPRWAMPGYGGLALIDWQDEVFRTAPKPTYDLSVAGSTAKTNYRMSLGYVNQEGTAINTSYDRLSARLNVQSAIHDRVTIGTVSYTHLSSGRSISSLLQAITDNAERIITKVLIQVVFIVVFI